MNMFQKLSGLAKKSCLLIGAVASLVVAAPVLAQTGPQASQTSTTFITRPAYGPLVLQTNSAGLIGGFTNQFTIAPNVTNGTNFVGNTNLACVAWRIPPGGGFAFFADFIGTNNFLSGSNVQFNFNVTYDGTNWTSSNPLLAVFPLGPTNDVAVGGTSFRGYTNFNRSLLDNVYAIRLDGLQHWHSNHIYVSNMVATVFK